MNFQKGDFVTRKSYNNDTIFKILNIKENICYLKGIDVRLYADAEITDLWKKMKIQYDDFIRTTEPLNVLYLFIASANVVVYAVPIWNGCSSCLIHF